MFELAMGLVTGLKKEHIIALIFIGLIGGAFWAGVEWEKGQVAQVEVEETKVEVETHNANTITQDKHEAAMLQLERRLRRSLASDPRHIISDACPADQLTVMRNDKIEKFNSTLFPSSN